LTHLGQVSDARNFEVDLLNCALMKRKTPISTTGRPKTTDNPGRVSDLSGRFGDAARQVQQISEAQFHGFLEEHPDAIIIVDQTGCINFASNRVEAISVTSPTNCSANRLASLFRNGTETFMRVIWTVS